MQMGIINCKFMEDWATKQRKQTKKFEIEPREPNPKEESWPPQNPVALALLAFQLLMWLRKTIWTESPISSMIPLKVGMNRKLSQRLQDGWIVFALMAPILLYPYSYTHETPQMGLLGAHWSTPFPNQWHPIQEEIPPFNPCYKNCILLNPQRQLLIVSPCIFFVTIESFLWDLDRYYYLKIDKF